MSTVRSNDGTHIAFDRSGTGPALVLVDGAMCYRGAGPMTPLAGILAPHFTVYTYDRRGRGESGDTAPYTVEREIEDLAAVIGKAGGAAAVFGMSSGAVLALQAAAHGVAITKLALYEPPFTPDEDDRRRRRRAYATNLTASLAAARRGDAVELFMRTVGVPAEQIGHMRRMPMWLALEAIAPTLAYDSAVMADSVSGGVLQPERMAAVTVPTLVLAGSTSPEWMRDVARQVADTLERGQHGTLDGQTHDVAPDALAPALTEFLDQRFTAPSAAG